MRNGLVIVGVDFFLSPFKNFAINVFVDWNSALFVDRLGEIVALGMVVAVTKATVDFNPTFCRRKEGGRIDGDDAESIVNLNTNCIGVRQNRLWFYDRLNGRIFFYGYFRFRRNSF